jgi:hypothetical protein
MRLSVASSALAAAFVLMTPLAAGYAPALGQDFSITNQVEPANPGRRDFTRQLQAWWDAHAYYPRHASNNDEGGTVKVHLLILPDGNVWPHLVGSSGSPSLDAAGEAVFRGASVQRFPAGEPNVEMDISLHYVLAHRHDQPVAAGYTPVSTKSPFTIMNDPIKSPILETMLQRACTGTMVLQGIPNHPAFGIHYSAEAIFFRKPDGTPWVKFWERGHQSIAPVTQVGKMLTWTGRQEHSRDGDTWLQYTVWPDGDNSLSGAIGGRGINRSGTVVNSNVAGNYLDLSCATEALPAVTWNDLISEQNNTTSVPLSVLAPIDPP